MARHLFMGASVANGMYAVHQVLALDDVMPVLQQRLAHSQPALLLFPLTHNCNVKEPKNAEIKMMVYLLQ